jgi:RHS repeat-associated protein
MSPSTVIPGQSATFNFQARAPSTPGTYPFQWGMVWEHHQRFGQTSTTYVTVPVPTTPKPTISASHTAMVAGQSFTMSWSTTNATSLTHACTAAGTGYTVNEALAVSGSRAMTAQAAWVSYPSTCTWTASGAGGTTTYTETLTTTAAATPKPTINVSRPSLVAGQSFTTSWSTLDATSLTHVCTASGTGYTVNEALAVNGSRALTAQSGWVGYPSSCTWTASGAGGSAAYTETMTTVAAANSSVTYIHTDGLGSPVARTDASGNPISRTRYEPYGYVASGVQPTIGFTGHVNDVDTGLTYMQQRYYDPVAGRFLSNDPVVTDVGSGGGFNRYYYANNNPFAYIDSDGRESAPTTVTIVGTRGAAGFLAWLAAFWQSQPHQASSNNDDLSIQSGCGCGASAGASGIPPDDDDDPRGRSRSSSRSRNGKAEKKEKSPNQLNEEINRGQAPKEVKRVDTGKVTGEQTHAHFKDGSALNKNGTWKHGQSELSNATKNWLIDNGWKLPK